MALVVTVIILLILAGVTITYVLGDRGIIQITKDARSQTDEAVDNEQKDIGDLSDWLKEEKEEIKNATGKWTQNKTNVTNGKITLEVGQEVTGYTANSVGDGNWCVLGAKDGKLLITTNSNQEEIIVVPDKGATFYTNGVSTLNAIGEKFKDANMAELARSIDVDDINRVTGYDPDVAKFKNDETPVAEWKNEVTYTLNSDGIIHFQGTKFPTTDTSSEETSFTYWNGSNWISLENTEGKNSVTLTSNAYGYYPQTLSLDASKADETKINGSTKAYTLLFANTSGDGVYLLSSQAIFPYFGVCWFCFRQVNSGAVGMVSMFYSSDESIKLSAVANTPRFAGGVRPVVSLKSNVKVTSDGALSI